MQIVYRSIWMRICHEETLKCYSLSKGLEIRIADNQEML